MGAAALGLPFWLAGCGTPRMVATPASEPAAEPPGTDPVLAQDVAIYALGLVGTPYRYGGNTPDAGFDCSGLINHVYRSRAGLRPPRTVAELQDWGLPVARHAVRAGDLVLFGRGTGAATHAGIYVGEGRFVHAPSTGGEVRLDTLGARHWAAQAQLFRRP